MTKWSTILLVIGAFGLPSGFLACRAYNKYLDRLTEEGIEAAMRLASVERSTKSGTTSLYQSIITSLVRFKREIDDIPAPAHVFMASPFLDIANVDEREFFGCVQRPVWQGLVVERGISAKQIVRS
ncbi:hypothetical protein SAMN04488118_11712 [Epibacterium ulvae]|uniref:Uncharacterized protein n=1 Tax=Epibacterium ulvae TaxID=1156985 RepID=A0A1G5RH69_9RHOB|nr:hypothetical protein [Epibacterium ulvae]SCZ73377.1 hypothetical protein SAMN04488118_11712 [Epibacterium ulvae]